MMLFQIYLTFRDVSGLGISENDVALLDLGENITLRPEFHKFLRPMCLASGKHKLLTPILCYGPNYAWSWSHSQHVDHFS